MTPLPHNVGEGATRTEGLAHLEFAIAAFRAMAMQPALERALRLEEAVGGRQ